MYRGSRHLGKIIGPYSRPYVPTSAARMRNASVGAGAPGGQSCNVQSGRYNKPAGCNTPVVCRGRPWKQTNRKNKNTVGSMCHFHTYQLHISENIRSLKLAMFRLTTLQAVMNSETSDKARSAFGSQN
jgi:hypothetical protein